MRQYGERLVCVRYRYDAQRKKRYKTVELIVEETDWQPRTGSPTRSADHMVGVRIGYGEAEHLLDEQAQRHQWWHTVDPATRQPPLAPRAPIPAPAGH